MFVFAPLAAILMGWLVLKLLAKLPAAARGFWSLRWPWKLALFSAAGLAGAYAPAAWSAYRGLEVGMMIAAPALALLAATIAGVAIQRWSSRGKPKRT